MSKSAYTQRERNVQRMRHTVRIRRTTTAKTANVGSKPPKPTATPPIKAHTKRTATYATKPTANHFTNFLMPVGAEPKPRFQSCRISILFFPYNDFPIFIYPVSSSTLRGSGCEATYGAPKNLQARFAPCGFWRKFFNPSSGAVENFSPKALHIFSPSVSAP